MVDTPTAKKFSRSQLEDIKADVDLMRFTAQTILKICDKIDQQMGYKNK